MSMRFLHRNSNSFETTFLVDYYGVILVDDHPRSEAGAGGVMTLAALDLLEPLAAKT